MKRTILTIYLTGSVIFTALIAPDTLREPKKYQKVGETAIVFAFWPVIVPVACFVAWRDELRRKRNRRRSLRLRAA